MNTFNQTIIIRHKKENRKKCSLTPLEKLDQFLFYRYPDQLPKTLPTTILLAFDGEELSLEDQAYPLMILDSTWHYLPKIEKATLPLGVCLKRSLPKTLSTAYPRAQTHCAEPQRGLASIEAIIAAFAILQKDVSFLLPLYRWSKEFIEQNRSTLKMYRNSSFSEAMK